MLLWFSSLVAIAAPLEPQGSWYKASREVDAEPILLSDTSRYEPVSHTSNTGGRFIFKGTFSIKKADDYVIDFKNSSVIGRFAHHIYDEKNKEFLTLKGGIQSKNENPYMLRHGRPLKLGPGQYTLISVLDSPFYLAQPSPYITTEADYRQAIKYGNALVMLCLGGMLILLIYYGVLGIVRQQVSDTMYAFFILGNLLYNGTALLVYPDLLGMHWFYLISLPILFSNMAYILFATHLLGIQERIYPKLYKLSRWMLYLFGLFIVAALLAPSWSLEFDRIGVGLMMLYGLVAGSICAYRGNLTARFYLAAIVAFFAIGSYSITNANLPGIYTIYIEHFGMLAVTVEMVLLALVLARQFAQLHHEKEHALVLSERNLQIAYTDALTGLPNRYALDRELSELPHTGVLVFVDIDGLKFYNDNFGHKRGDELLSAFANSVKAELQQHGVLHRIGGDEFAITCHSGNIQLLENKLQNAMRKVHEMGFDFSGVSYGIAWAAENSDKNMLKHLADTRMYANKRKRKHELAVS